MTTAELLARGAKQGTTTWIIEGLLRPGLTILGGAPKVGKSRLALDMSASVVRGRLFLGAYASTKVHVLYWALEPMAEDVTEAIRTFQIPADVDIDWRLEMPPGTDFAWFEAEIAAVKTARPDLKLVVLDMYDHLPRPIMPGVRSTDHAYDQIRHRLRAMQEVAKRHQLAVVALMHTSAYTGELIGGAGVSGTADAVWKLSRDQGSTTGTLNVTGRSVREQAINMSWCPERGMWLPRGVDSALRVDVTKVLAEEAVGHVVDEIVGAVWVTRPELLELTAARLRELGRSDAPKYLATTVDRHTSTRVKEGTYTKHKSRPVRYRRSRIRA